VDRHARRLRGRLAPQDELGQIVVGQLAEELEVQQDLVERRVADALADPERRAVDAIERRRRFVVIPWQMGIVGAALRMLPRPLYDSLFARAPRKPRRDAAVGS